MSLPYRTAEQTRSDNVAAMGEEVGKIYSALWQEVALIHKRWGQYVALFGTSPSRIDLLNEAAPQFFRTVQDALWEAMLLHLARLSDPPKSVGKENLSVRRLTQAVANTSISPAMTVLEASVMDSTLFARDWRNRKLAHRDLELAVEAHADPLAPASRASVKAALAALTEFLNAFSSHFLDSTTMFNTGDDGGDALSLLYVLKDGLTHDKERLAKIKNGELSYTHLHHDPI